MDAKATPHVSLLATQGTPSLSTSLSTGSLPIRAPITPDDEDDSDSDSSGYKTDTSESHTSSSIDNNGYKSEEFASGEDFETASERPSAGDAEEENAEESNNIDKFPIFRPFVANPDEESLSKSVVDEDRDMITNEYSHAFELNSPNAKLVMPIAQLSLDDDDFDELVGDEGKVSEEEDNKFSQIAKIPSFGVLQRVDSAPRVKVVGAEADELLVDKDFCRFNPSEPLPLSDYKDSASGESFGADNGVSNSKDDTVVAKKVSADDFISAITVDDSVSVACVQDDGRVITPEAHGVSLVHSKNNGLEENFEQDEDEKCLVYDSVSVELIKKDAGPTVRAEIHNESSVESKEDVEGELDTAMQPIRETLKTFVLELQELKVIETRVDGDEIVDVQNKCCSPGIIRNVAFEKSSESVELEGKTRQEPDMEHELSLTEGSITDESMDDSVELNEIQTLDLMENFDLPETSKSDGLEDARHTDADFVGFKEVKSCDSEKIGEQKGLISDDDIEDLIFGCHGTTLAASSLSEAEGSPDHLQEIDEQIVMDSDEEEETDKEQRGEELFDYAALASLLKAVTNAELDGGPVTTTSTGFGLSFPNMRLAPQLATADDIANHNLSEEEKNMMEKIQHLRVKFLRLVLRLGQSPEDSMVAQVLHRLVLSMGGHLLQEFGLESTKRLAMQLEGEGKDDLDFSLNILVLGKTGVGKSATINSIFNEKRAMSNAFEPATTKVKEIVGVIDGVKIRIIDTPGLRSSAKEESVNRKILASVKKFMKKFPPDVVLYVDRLDTHARDLNDLPLLNLLTNSLSTSIWRNAIVTLTHAASLPPDGSSGSPLSFELFVAQRSHVVQQAISQAVGDLRLMHPSMMHPVSLVENHPLCQKNTSEENLLPNGRSGIPQLLLLCYSLKILSEASLISKPRIRPYDDKKHLGFRFRSLPLPHLVSSLLQSHHHKKGTSDQAGDDVDSDLELLDLSDSDEDEDAYDQLPPFKPLRKSQVDKLSKEQRKAYFEEYDYRAKLLQKKQWRGEIKRIMEMKKKENDRSGHFREDVGQEDEGTAMMPVPVPDFILPPSFDGDNPSYRYRMLEPASELLVRPVLDSHGWDHDCGYDGVSVERSIAIIGHCPGAFALQITKDKKEFNIHLDSSISAKHGENGSSVAGFDIQTVGRQLAYILRSETKFKNFKMNKTAGGISVTLLGKNIATGLKIEDQIAVGKRLSLMGNVGAVRSGSDAAYGANLEVRVRPKDFPIEQDQSSLSLSLLNCKGDLGVMANLQSQFSFTPNSKMAIHVGMNNKRNGKISVKASSSELQTALFGIVPIVISIFRSIYPGIEARNSNKLDH